MTELFNLLTGYMRPQPLRHLLIAPLHLRSGLVERVRREAEHARQGRDARIIAKMNSLVDVALIDELYAASQAGVQISLIVRGICCLYPGVPGLSDNIRVTSIIDRFLEHARIFHFENGGSREYYLASADWMPRNLDKRVEAAFPVLEPALQEALRAILELQLADTEKVREIRSDGCSVRRAMSPDGPRVRSQERLYALAAPPSKDVDDATLEASERSGAALSDLRGATSLNGKSLGCWSELPRQALESSAPACPPR